MQSACGVARYQWESCLGWDVPVNWKTAKQITNHKAVNSMSNPIPSTVAHIATWEAYDLIISILMALCPNKKTNLIVNSIALYLLFFVNIETVCFYKTFSYIY